MHAVCPPVRQVFVMEGKEIEESLWTKYLFENGISVGTSNRCSSNNGGVLNQTRLKLIVDSFHIED